MAYYARSIVSDVEQGEKSFAQGLIEIETEHRSLSNQSREIALKGLGIVAGGFQIATGGGRDLLRISWNTLRHRCRLYRAVRY